MENLFERTISSNEAYTGHIFKVQRCSVQLPSGAQALREVVEPEDGVVIAAEIEGRILMVKQFRYPAQDVLYELPAGKLDKGGEGPLQAAKRELEEETGYTAAHWEELGYIWTTPGFCTEKLYIFKASGLTYTEQHLDDDEFLDCVSVSLDKMLEMIKFGIINDAKSIAAVMRAYQL